jgi:hypothetical protein
VVDIRKVYVSKYIQPDDIPNGQQVRLFIAGATVTKVRDRESGQDVPKILLNFHRTRKLLGLSPTNATRISAIYGPDTDYWIDQPIALQVEQVQVYGEVKPVVRVCPTVAPAPAAGPARHQSQPPPAPAPAREDPRPPPPSSTPPAAGNGGPPYGAEGDPFANTGQSSQNPQSGQGGLNLPDDDFDDDIPF